ncbi:MAG TPA: hypothetical protein VGJ37_12350 [Pyrinomonadaceae bacterium]|jgi:hypothetical protein
MNDKLEAARARLRKLAVFEVDARESPAAQSDWSATRLLLEAADVVDELFWQQAGPAIDYHASSNQPGDDDELRELLLFDPDFAGRRFYPPDLTREEFEAAINAEPGNRSSFESPYTIIRRDNTHLIAVPYHVAYGELVRRLSDLLANAATLERHPQLRAFLSQRAKDLLTDDYYASETLWVGLNKNPLDFVVGPYEVYEDELLGLKASYEAVLFEPVREATDRFQQAQRDLVLLCKDVESELGRRINIQDNRVKLAIANLVYAGGEARGAVPAIAFSLPNDERVIEEVGSRQVILKNVSEAKFNLVVHKLANDLLKESVAYETSFHNFFEHTVFHEISHSLGPQRIVVNGEPSTVNRALKQLHSTLEEAKADALGACLALIAGEDIDARLFLNSFVGNFVRSIRFGLEQAHGGANAIQFNYLLEQRAFRLEEKTRRISVDEARTREAVFKLAATILDIQEQGDFAGASAFVKKYCVETPELTELVERAKDLPIDIRIRYLNWKT